MSRLHGNFVTMREIVVSVMFSWYAKSVGAVSVGLEMLRPPKWVSEANRFLSHGLTCTVSAIKTRMNERLIASSSG